MEIKVLVIAYAVDINSRVINILYDDGLPSSLLDGQPVDTAKHIIETWVNTSADWLSPVLVNTTVRNNELIIIYSVMLPESLKLQRGLWIPSYELIKGVDDEFIQKILYEAARAR